MVRHTRRNFLKVAAMLSGAAGTSGFIPDSIQRAFAPPIWMFDHTSTLMFLDDLVQKKYGKTVREENISAWRRAISGNLTSCFRPHDAKEPKLDFLDRNRSE